MSVLRELQSLIRDAEASDLRMMLKSVPYSVFMDFFEDNPELRFLAHEFDEETADRIKNTKDYSEALILGHNLYGGKRGGSMKDAKRLAAEGIGQSADDYLVKCMKGE